MQKIIGLYTIAVWFRDSVRPALVHHEQVAGMVFTSNDGYDEKLKGESLCGLVRILQEFKSCFNKQLDGKASYVSSKLYALQKCLEQAPNVHFSREALATKLGGKQNIPAGRFTWEDTVKDMQALRNHMGGILDACEILQPAAVPA